MAARSPEELDRAEGKRQAHLASAKRQVRNLGLLFLALLCLCLYLTGYGKGRADAEASSRRPIAAAPSPPSEEVTSSR